MADPGARPRAPTLPALALLFNALVWGLSWWPLRALHDLGLHPLWTTALVFTMAALATTLARPGAWAVLCAQPWMWLLALAAGVTNVGFNWAVTIGDVVRVVLLFYLMPLWSVLLAWVLLGDRPRTVALARVAMALTGVTVVLKTPDVDWPLPQGAADYLALLGGFAFALTNVLLLRLAREDAAARVLAMFAGGACMAGVVALAGAAQALLPWPPAATAWLPLTLGLGLAFLLSNAALQYGAARLSAQATALIMLSEVVFASLSAVALGAATWNTRTLVGAVLIVGAALWAAWPCTRPGPGNPQ